MDAKQFDGFVRWLAVSAPRRRVVGLLLAGGFGGTLGLLGDLFIGSLGLFGLSGTQDAAAKSCK